MAERGIDWRSFVRTPWAVLAVWLIYALVRLAIQPLVGWEPVGPDDWTRLLQVRAWLDGQAFWDVTQYRMDPPQGFSMHWSRLVDMPLAALTLLFGEMAAMALVPLLWLLPALFALRSIMLRLDFAPLAFAFGLVLLPLFPMLPGVFAPMRIDHHSAQGVMALACAAFLLKDSRWSALACGLFAAMWVVISLEGLPLVAVIAGLYGLRYWWGERTLLPWFLGALAASAAALNYATRGPLEPLYCDVLLPGHTLTFAAAALMAALIPFLPWQDRAHGRVVALGLMGAVCLLLARGLLGPCATNPMAELDPVLQTWWHSAIGEGLPIWRQPPSVALTLVWAIMVIAAGWWRAHAGGLFHRGRALPFTLLFLYALAAGGYSLLVLREGVIAQLLAIPFGALLLAEYLPRARALTSAAPRIAATLAAIGLSTPLFASVLASPLDDYVPRKATSPDIAGMVETGECDYTRLAALPPGLVVMPLDAGPLVLGTSGHAIVAASYHRNQRAIADVLLAFTGSPESARAMISRYGAGYVAICAAAGDVALYRTASPENFANALLSDSPPEWLTLDEKASSGALRVYRVAIRPAGSPSPRR
ncbi:hypothetical protein [Aurantiacibacter poecillastricola]|uniref:hypothetical protein n=1 Tax=Aurantiacibacter poecillastricola TaxID=3064385 RepID=UPI00273DCDC6|nr:hypothetical protein [Aurantiacibacter sp. 219JJ12-13]MDP5260664.1 hypothetical protein [Aurantiacibacter sp. 219JJ12-13]